MRKISAFLLVIVLGLLLGGCFPWEKPPELSAVISTDPQPAEGLYPLTVRFYGGRSQGDVATYTWDFGDGSPLASGSSVSHTYTDPGEYTAVLVVRDGKGREARAEVSVRVHSLLPVVDDLGVDRDVLNAEQTIYFYAQAHDPDGEVRYFHWDFGDGSPEAVTPEGRTSHAYMAEGDYTASVRAEDDNGDLSEPATVVIHVLPPCHCGG